MIFSVAVNAYNRAGELGETLEAILSQRHAAAEVIVVDDGSTDNTHQVAERFGPRVRVVRTPNTGPGMSRHTAVTHCSSPWVACCDSDDLWRPDHLLQLARTIARHPETCLAFGNATWFGPEVDSGYDHFATAPDDWWAEAVQKREGPRFLLKADTYARLLRFQPVYVSCLAVRRCAYDAIGGASPAFSRLPAEDFDVTARLAAYGRVCGTFEIGAALRKYDRNFSGSFARNTLGGATIIDAHLADGVVPQDSRAKVERASRAHIVKAFRHACWENDANLARSAFARVRLADLTARDYARFCRTLVDGKLGRKRGAS